MTRPYPSPVDQLVAAEPSTSLSQAAALLAAEQLRRGERLVVTVHGASMRPILQLGDQVLIAPTKPHTWFRGQLLAVREADGLLVHRLAGWDDATCLLKGDACADLDPPVSRADVIGEVVAVRLVADRLDDHLDVPPLESTSDEPRPKGFRSIDGRWFRQAHKAVGTLSAAQARFRGGSVGDRLCRRVLGITIMLADDALRRLL